MNRNRSFDKVFNLITRLSVEIGKRYGGKYLFGGVSLNYFIYEEVDGTEPYSFQSLTLDTGKLLNLESMFWPGYTAGLQF